MEKEIKEAISIIEDVRKSMPECTNKAFLKGAINELNEALKSPTANDEKVSDEEIVRMANDFSILNYTPHVLNENTNYIMEVAKNSYAQGFRSRLASPSVNDEKEVVTELEIENKAIKYAEERIGTWDNSPLDYDEWEYQFLLCKSTYMDALRFSTSPSVKSEGVELGICKERNCSKNAVIDYNGHGHYVCQGHYESLTKFFEAEYD